MKKITHTVIMFISMITKTKKSSYYLSYKHYDSIVDKYRNGQYYGNLLKRIKNDKKINSDAEIALVKNKLLNKIGERDVIKKFGKPVFKFNHDNLPNINILLYREKLGKHKVKTEYHFFKNSLFLYSYTFSNLSSNDKSEMLEVIQKKYFNGDSIDFKNEYIADKNSNLILVNNNDLSFSIYYLCDLKTAFDKISEYMDFKKTEAIRKEEFIKKKLYKKL